MTIEFGADPALVASQSSPVARSRPSGFDPGEFRPQSYDGKPRHMPKARRKELDALLNAARTHIDSLTPYRRNELLQAFLSVSQVNCSWQHFGLAKLFVYEVGAAVAADALAQKDGGHE